MSDNPTDFPDAYRRHVIPRLRNRCLYWGTMIAIDQCDYAEARANIMTEARKYGATFLPDRIFDDLMDFIDATLLNAIFAAEAVTVDIRAEVQSDPVRHYSRIAAEAKNPGVTRALMAISPEFRAHVQAKKAAKNA